MENGFFNNILTFCSCKDQKKALAICLQRSPCVLIERNTPKKCLSDPELKKDLPELCIANFRAFMECRNGMFDMRKRMKGNAPLSTGKYDDTYENLSSGNFEAHEEMKKLEVLNRNLSRQRLLREEQERARLAGTLEKN
jgi:cytochrome c oxidase assembly factor 5